MTVCCRSRLAFTKFNQLKGKGYRPQSKIERKNHNKVRDILIDIDPRLKIVNSLRKEDG